MRTKNSIFNLVSALTGQFFDFGISLIARVFFIQQLGTTYLGLNSLFANLLTVFSLVELGAGTAISFALYQPIATRNHAKIKSLMQLYRKIYLFVATVVATIGLAMLPFYRLFIGGNPQIPELNVIYLLFVANAAASYLFAHKRTLIICDQRKYLTTIYRYGFYFLLNVAQIIALVLTSNYILFLVLQIISTLLENILVSLKADKLYPFLKAKSTKSLPKKELRDIRQNIYAMSIHKVGGVVVNSTDSILISTLVGLTSVGLYANYQIILSAIESVTYQFFYAIVAGVGNLHTEQNSKKMHAIFLTAFHINYLMYSFCAICFFNLINAFISVWVGSNLVFDTGTVLIITICLYLKGMRRTVITFRDAMGLFWHDRYKPAIEAVINLVASIILGIHFGVAGIFIGTIISTITTSLWVEPYILYKHGFKMSVRPYFKRLFIYTLVTLGTGIIVALINMAIIAVIDIFILRVISTIIFTAIFTFLPFIKTPETKTVLDVLRRTFQKGLKICRSKCKQLTN